MDWNDLRYFHAVARAGTLVGAARELGVEHSTVGRRVAALEAELGVRLVIRGPAGLTLTEAGNEILNNVEAIAEQVSTIERRVAGGDTRVEGVVRLTVPEAENGYVVSQMPELRERHPALTLDIVSDNRELDLRRGEADIALRFRDSTDPELVIRKVGSAGWSLYASESYLERKGRIASAESLDGYDVIGFDGSLSGVVGATWLGEHGKSANIVLRGNSLRAIASAAAVGLGIAVLPCSMGDCNPALQRLTPRVVGSRDISLVVHPDLLRVARVRATLDYLIEVFTRDAERWSGRVTTAG